MDISLILCTYNRAHLLGAAIESVLASKLAPGTEWEVLIVDNNSSDHTRAVVNAYCNKIPSRVRYVFQAKQGLSNARNAGIREAQGRIIAFTDDDVTVEPSWLQNLTAPLHDDQWAGTGGRVCAPQDFVHPDWLVMDGGLMDSSGVLALFDAGTTAVSLTRPPFGANMAFRKEVFKKYGDFRPELGRCGSSLIGNEDTEFGSRLMNAGESILYDPAAIVYHPVSKERLSKKYFLRWWFSYGKAMCRQNGSRPAIWGIPRVYLSLLTRASRWLVTSPWKPKLRFYWKCRLWVAAGELIENYSERSEATVKIGIKREG